MAAMMPSASTAASDPYDNDAVERDLIDPDDGAHTYLGGSYPPVHCANHHTRSHAGRPR